MFGQPSTPFGSSATSGFGAPASTPAFGSPAPTFGAPAPAPSGFGGFGTPAPAPSSFGGFGAPAPAPSTGFGGSTFGAPAPSAFGSSAGGFGAAPANTATAASSPFGAPAPAPSGGLFGSAPAASGFGSSFGSPAPAPAFASTTFGAPAPSAFGAPTPGPFGAPAPAPSTGLFGAAPAPSSGFGAPAGGFGAPAPASSGLFGSPPPAATGGLFGAPAAPVGGQGGGTKMAPYAVTSRQDGSNNISLQAITAMAPYENKSIEELRFEDYSQGNKGTGSGAGAAGGGFGGFGTPAPAPSGGLFGANPAPAPTAFGAAPAPATGFGSSFGSPAPAPAFGGSAFGAPAPSAFGAPAPSAFGAPAPAPSGGLFGAAPAPAQGGLFGSAPAPSTGLFGAPAPAPGGLFGSAPAPSPGGGLFGAPAAPAPAGGLFGQAPAAGGLFGQPSAPSSGFGAPAPQGLFGAPAPGPAPGGFGFGASPAPAQTNSLFGAPAPQAAFGASPYGAPPAMSPAYPMGPMAGYGAPAATTTISVIPPAGSIIPPATNEILAQQLSAMENQRKEMEKMSVWKSPEGSAVVPSSLPETTLWESSAPLRGASYSPFRRSPKSGAKIRPRGFTSPEKPAPRLTGGGRPIMTPETVATSSITRLVIKPSPKPKLRLVLENPARQYQNGTAALPASNIRSPQYSNSNGGTSIISNGHANSNNVREKASLPTVDTSHTHTSHHPTTSPRTPGYDYYQQVVASPTADDQPQTPSLAANPPKLTKAGYDCAPSIEVLSKMSGEDLAAVADFSIEREGFGHVEWEGAVDVRGANLDDIAEIEQSTVSMYMKDEEVGRKPEVGSKLNRPATITLYNVFPKNGGKDASDALKAKFAQKVEKQTKNMGARFISYDASAGEWKMRVQHFSKYGLLDDEDSDADMEDAKGSFRSGGLGGSSLVEKKRVAFAKGSNAEEDGDRGEQSEDNMEIVLVDTAQILEKAEEAFQQIDMSLNLVKEESANGDEDVDDFHDEGFQVAAFAVAPASMYIPSVQDLEHASNGSSITSKLSQRHKIQSSSVDFGMRFRRSFRVGWRRDGSFFTLGSKAGTIVARKPVFTTSRNDSGSQMLETHMHFVKKNDDRDPSSTSLSFSKAEDSESENLSNALKAYSDGMRKCRREENDDADIQMQTFSLLSYLLPAIMMQSADASDGEKNCNSSNAAVKEWLVDSCSSSVNNEIGRALKSGDSMSAVFAAVTGGDIATVCQTATGAGLHQLAAIVSSGPARREEVLAMIRGWANSGKKVPQTVLRLFRLLGGNSKLEEDLYRGRGSKLDWRRRLLVDLAYTLKDDSVDLNALIEKYDSTVAAGGAPHPTPLYLAQEKSQHECILFRLLRFGSSFEDYPVSKLINPHGYTSFIHDFELAFHLSEIVARAGCSSGLSEVEDHRLKDGFAAQLLQQGRWEWAAYICMCQLSDGESEFDTFWTDQARSILFQHFVANDSSGHDKRAFLESLGVPSEWFEESLAMQHSYEGDFYKHLIHEVKFAPDQAGESLSRSAVLRNILFMEREDVDKYEGLLKVFAADEESTSSALFAILRVKEALAIMKGGGGDRDLSTTELIELCDHAERILAREVQKNVQRGKGNLDMIAGCKAATPEMFLAEGMSQVTLLKLRLKALEAGIYTTDLTSLVANLSRSSPQQETADFIHTSLRWVV